tara:strand:- start:1049 stop:1510 length:462 start_codon:yes stop_codon:yes gene_type:complete
MTPRSSELFAFEKELFNERKETINKKMIKDFLIISFTGKNNFIGLKINSNFFIKRFQTNIKDNKLIVNNILQFTKQKKAKIDKNFSVIVNLGPGSFSGVRISLAIGKGIEISKGANLYGYRNVNLRELNRKNIELLIMKNLIEKSLIKPVYIS